jgi:predicted secreted protein
VHRLRLHQRLQLRDRPGVPRPLMVVVALAVAGVAASSCSVSDRGPAPRDELGRTEIVLDERDANRTVAVRLGASITLNLPADPGSGLAWTIDPALDPSIVQVDPPQFHPTGARPNGPGVEVWRFRAVGPGSVIVRMSYDSPSALSSGAREFRFILSVA